MQEATSATTPGGAPPRVRFGIFDWVDANSGLDQAALYDARLQMVEYADEAGYWCYQLAEHHWTPLSLTPSPSLFLASVAQRTRRIRLGPLVYLLPLYSPLRLIEEICMLDHLSHGRLEVGVGRGASPYELQPYNLPLDELREVFQEALTIVLQGLSTGEVNFEGKYYTFKDVKTVQRPLQRPYPPLWYPTNYTRSVEWIGQHNFSMVFGSIFPSFEQTREQFDILNAARAAHAGTPDRYNGHVADPCHGLVRHVIVADTDARAHELGRAAYDAFQASFGYLWDLHNAQRPQRRGDWESAVEQGVILVGSPDTVRARLQDILRITGMNYFAGAFAFGDLPTEHVLRSLRLFAAEVMPALA